MSNRGKGKDIGNQNYKAMDGNMKTFNVIDYSHKTKVHIGSDFDIDKDRNDLDNIKKDRIEEILTRNPKNCPERFEKCIIADFNTKTINWNIDELNNSFNDLWGDLYKLKLLLSNYEIRDKEFNHLFPNI